MNPDETQPSPKLYAIGRGSIRLPFPGEHGWSRALLWLALAWLGLLLLFARDARALAAIWWNSATFGYCLFIAPVSGWLAWQRRRELVCLTPQGWWPGLLLVAAGGFAWLFGSAAEVSLFRQIGLVVMGQGAAVSLLGPQVSRGLSFPLAYLLFLVPFGESLDGPLQKITIRILMPLLHYFGVPAMVDGVLITMPNGYFEVAEACSGTRFVIAMLAYGVLVANVCYVSWWRRAAFLAMALIVPIPANGLRAFVTLYLAWLTSVEAATGFDHIFYGWIFFGLVMAAVLAIGWRWFDRDPDAPMFDPASLQTPVRHGVGQPVAMLLVLMIASLFLGWSNAIAGRADHLPAPVLPEVPGWQRVPLSSRVAWRPNFPAADHYLFGRYRDARGQSVDLAVAIYAGQREGKKLVGFGIGALGPDSPWVRVAAAPAIAGGDAIRMTGPGRVERETVTWYRLGGIVTGSASRVKLETLKRKLLGGPQRAVAVLVSAEYGDQDADRAIADFIAAAGPVDRLADRVAGTGQ